MFLEQKLWSKTSVVETRGTGAGKPNEHMTLDLQELFFLARKTKISNTTTWYLSELHHWPPWISVSPTSIEGVESQQHPRFLVFDVGGMKGRHQQGGGEESMVGEELDPTAVMMPFHAHFGLGR